MNSEDTFLDFSRISRSNTSPHIAKGKHFLLLRWDKLINRLVKVLNLTDEIKKSFLVNVKNIYLISIMSEESSQEV